MNSNLETYSDFPFAGLDVFPDVSVDFADDVTFNAVNVNVNGNAGGGEQLPMVNRSRASSLEIRVNPPSSCGGK